MSQKQPTDKARSNSESRMEHRMKEIEEAAYLKAERRDFTPGHELEDWLEAEREVDEAALAMN